MFLIGRPIVADFRQNVTPSRSRVWAQKVSKNVSKIDKKWWFSRKMTKNAIFGTFWVIFEHGFWEFDGPILRSEGLLSQKCTMCTKCAKLTQIFVKFSSKITKKRVFSRFLITRSLMNLQKSSNFHHFHHFLAKFWHFLTQFYTQIFMCALKFLVIGACCNVCKTCANWQNFMSKFHRFLTNFTKFIKFHTLPIFRVKFMSNFTKFAS